jgi:hypothetical protein
MSSIHAFGLLYLPMTSSYVWCHVEVFSKLKSLLIFSNDSFVYLIDVGLDVPFTL